MWSELAKSLSFRSGHFELESGHHGNRWFDLELLFRRPDAVRPLITELATRLADCQAELVCGPLVEGAFVALQVASELGVDFTYAERRTDHNRDGLFPVDYRIPGAQRDLVRGRRVAIVNDVINAGSSVRATLADLEACSASTVAIASLLSRGRAPERLASDARVPLVVLAKEPNTIWPPDECPLCMEGIAVVPHHGS